MRALLQSLIVLGTVAVATVPFASARADISSESDPQAAPAEGHAAASERHGIVALIDEALAGVTLRADQATTLKELGEKIDKDVAEVHRAKKAYVLALADQVEADSVDPSLLHEEKERVIDAAKEVSPKVRKALETIHDTLDASQRKQFVSAFREALKKQESKLEPQAKVEEWSKTLNLTVEQKQKLAEILREDPVRKDVRRARIELLLAAFPGERFSVDELVPKEAVRHRTERMLDRMAEKAERVTKILTPEQRKLAAQKIRERVSGGAREPETGKASSRLEAAGQALQIWFGTFSETNYRSSDAYAFSQEYSSDFGTFYVI